MARTLSGERSGRPFAVQTPPPLGPAAGADVLQAVVEGVTEVLGFGIAAISVLRRPDDDRMRVVAVAGPASARAQLLGSSTPMPDLRAGLAVAEAWGTLRFVPHDLLLPGLPLGWVPGPDEAAGAAGPADAWHPLDQLLAPLPDASGRIRGLLAVDLPMQGRLPDQQTRGRLELYAEQAARALVSVLEREALQEQVRLAGVARAVARACAARTALPGLVASLDGHLATGFRADRLWLLGGDAELRVPDDLADDVAHVSAGAWTEQRPVVAARGPSLDTDRRRAGAPPLSATERSRLAELADRGDVDSLLVVPLGVGAEWLGALVLGRRGDDPWSEAELDAARDVGMDLGRSVLDERVLARERRLLAELRAVDAYKDQLISTVAHELKSPLTAISGHGELLVEAGLAGAVGQSAAAVQRAAGRMSRLVEDLLVLARTGPDGVDGAGRATEPVDMAEVVAAVAELLDLYARERGVRLEVEAPDDRVPTVVEGDAEMLDRLCQNLVGNAVKYSDPGGTVRVRLARTAGEAGLPGDDGLLLEVADQGIGIAPADLDRLFTEFFRAHDPAARSRPGTGLGLTIVQRITDRHGGRVEVSSTPGEGSTFRVHLPALAVGTA